MTPPPDPLLEPHGAALSIRYRGSDTGGEAMTDTLNPLHLTRRGRRGFNHCLSCAGSLRR